VVATAWTLLLNGVIGYQVLEDGTRLSLGLVLVSSGIIFIGSGYIALDHGFSFTPYWNSTLDAPNLSYSLYTIYLLAPLVFIVVYFILEGFLVVRVLGEYKPLGMISASAFHCPSTHSLTAYLLAAGLLFALGQIFQFVVSVHICTGTSGKINGGLFEVLFTLLSVIMIWVFWSSITEDDWPVTYS
jgi:hypothetical protein